MDGKKDFSALYIPAAIVIAGAIIGASLILAFSKNGGSAAQTDGTQQAMAVDIKDVKLDDDPYIGNKNAPAMAYWSDFQCPYCKVVEVGGVEGISIEPSIPTIIKEYVNTGKLRIVFKDFPFLGKDSLMAAKYEHAIWETYPDKFYQWREAMYKAQDDEGDRGFGDEASIIALIERIPGMDAQKLKTLVAEKGDEYQMKIDADRAEGTKFGITGTPGFIIGKKQIVGADTLANFRTAIEAVVKK